MSRNLSIAPPRLRALLVKPFLQHLGIRGIQFHKSPEFRAGILRISHLLMANDQDFSGLSVERIEPQHFSGFINRGCPLFSDNKKTG
jgi:hypothetical protein